MVDRLVLELEPRLELLHGDAKAASLLSALSEAKSYASKDQLWSWRGSSARILRFRNCRQALNLAGRILVGFVGHWKQ